MATPNNVNPNQASGQNTGAKKKDFSGFLRAVEAERFNPANNPEKPLLLRRRLSRQQDDVLNVRLLQATGVLVSAIWLAGAAVYIQRSIGWSNISSMMPHEMGGFLAGILSPIALFWMVAAFILRSNDVKKYAETLREEIQTMIFPSEEADRRVNNDIERLMRQTSEMSKATRMALGAIEAARESLKQEVSSLHDNSDYTVERLNNLGEALHVRMQDVTEMGHKLEQMMQTMEERARHVSERMDAGHMQIEQSVNRIDQSSQTMGARIMDVTQNSEQSIARLSEMLQERLEALSGLHKETETALQNAAYEMSAQRQELRVEAEAVEEKAYSLVEALRKGTGELYNFTDDALDKAKLIETRLQSQSASLQNILSQSVDNANLIADTTEENMAKLSQSLESQTQALQQATTHAVDEAYKVGSNLEESITQSIRLFEETGSKNARVLLDASNEAVEQARKAGAHLQESMTHHVDVFERATEETSESLSRLVEKAVADLRETIEANENALTDTTQKVAETFTDLLSGTVSNLRLSVEENTAHLQETARQAVYEAEKIKNLMQDSVNDTVDVFREAYKVGSNLEESISQSIQMFEETGSKNARVLLDASNEAVEQARKAGAHLQESMTHHVDVFERATEETSESLSRLVEKAVADLRETIEANENALTDTTQKVAETFTDLLSGTVSNLRLSVEENTAHLQETARQAVYEAEKIKNLMQDSVNDTVDVFRNVTGENTYALQVASNEAVERAHKVENVLQQAIDRLAERSGEVLQKAQNVMGQATTTLISEVDQVGERAKTISDTMLTEVNRKVADTSAAFTYIQKQIQALVSLFDQRKLDLDHAGTSARETAETLQKTLQLALDKVTDVTQSMQTGIGSVQKAVQQPIRLLEDAANFAYSRAGEISQMLGDKAVDMTDAAGKIGSEMLNIHDKLHDKGQDVAELASKIASHLKSLTGELELQNQHMNERVSRTVESLGALKETQHGLNDDLVRLQEQNTLAKTQSEETSDTIQKRISILQNLHKALVDDASASDRDLHQLSDRLSNISSTTVDKIKHSIESMTLLEADYHRLSDAGLQDIQRIEQGYKQLLDQVKTDTKDTAETLTDIHAGIEEKTRLSRDAVEAELQALQQTAQHVHQTADHLLTSGDEIKNRFSHVQDLGQSAYTTLQNLVALSQGFDDKVGKANDLVTTHIDSLQDSIIRIQDQATQTVSALTEQTEQAQTLHAQLDKAAETGEEATKRIQTQLDALRQESHAAETVILQSALHLQDQQHAMRDAAQETAQALAAAKAQAQQHAADMLARLQQAVVEIDTNATILERAAQTAEEQAEALRIRESKLSRQAFFNSAKFIVESLHSLALDFTRLLEGEVEDKTWKAYQKGDAASFTRRLLSARDEDTRQKIVEKFKNDVEFRTYVQRYFRQFEEIYDDATTNDHAELLISVFNGSDVGKLYQFLCNVLEHEPRSPAK